MPKIRNGSMAIVTGNVVIRQKDGAVKSCGEIGSRLYPVGRISVFAT